MVHLAAIKRHIFLGSWLRPKTELKESEYWTYKQEIIANDTVSAGCVNKQLFDSYSYIFNTQISQFFISRASKQKMTFLS